MGDDEINPLLFGTGVVVTLIVIGIGFLVTCNGVM